MILALHMKMSSLRSNTDAFAPVFPFSDFGSLTHEDFSDGTEIFVCHFAEESGGPIDYVAGESLGTFSE